MTITKTSQELPKPMRVSTFFKLRRAQPTLDFVDVDIYGDLPVFIDPRAIRLLQTPWGDECVHLIQDFFQTVLSAIQTENHKEARKLLGTLKEPNETHLGLSRGPSRGRALGSSSARDVWQSLKNSEAAKSGLLEDLEDTILMVEGIAADIVSDITTNIIRDPLIEYTNQVCKQYEIPMTQGVASGPLWNPRIKEWSNRFVDLPVVRKKRLLLVPKVIVRRRMDYDVNEYYRHYLLEHLKEVELSSNTELVRLLRDGRRKVNKKDVIKKYGQGKGMIVRETLRNPQILEQYRRDKRKTKQPPLTHYEIAEAEGTELPDWESLISNVLTIKPGNDGAKDYEKAIEQVLTVLFYPALANPVSQRRIHEGRKIVDITYSNVATNGFFRWLSLHYPAPHIFVECKNYGKELGNPELDQLAGRFSPSRGSFGILVCRNFADKKLFTRRCHDTASDRRGYIIPIDDDDLKELVQYRRENEELLGNVIEFPQLKESFDSLIM